jgi:hypothetical protein
VARRAYKAADPPHATPIQTTLRDLHAAPTHVPWGHKHLRTDLQQAGGNWKHKFGELTMRGRAEAREPRRAIS